MWVIEPAGRINLGVDDEYDYNQHKDSVATLVSMLSMYLLHCYTDHWYQENKNENADVCGTSASADDSGGRQRQVRRGPASHHDHFIQVHI